ncbi:hypothetical protein RI844_00880 [Thalassotalea fonticola]|uniref:Uncharacterized protein n=1 Tax=Thalassotalea fonticola TaxID=3065649 RepID=A0ABZ0GQ77_9GAMM|nr:hypothetical protein RI844_00880 [Colwelliaceae bacterium S1-1]
MDIQQSIQTIITLANGVNPITGEVFPAESPYNSPEIIRALFTCLEHIKNPLKRGRMSVEQKQQANELKGLPKNCGLPWTGDVKTSLAENFNNGENFKQLAQHFQRTTASIKAELLKQGLITEDDSKRY